MKPIAVHELTGGVQWWQTKTWPRDFHNSDYETLTARNPNGEFTDDWWAEFLPRLTAWVALRPFSQAGVTELLAANRSDLTAAWRQVCEPVKDKDITGVTWDQLRTFPEVVARLKPTRSRSPVFPSKFCHFLLPRVFPVVDNQAVSASCTYEEYFNLIKGTWEITPADVQTALIAELTRLVEEEGRRPLYAGFPLVTKIVELAFIGRKHCL